mgnify:CR=1 FL=1
MPGGSKKGGGLETVMYKMKGADSMWPWGKNKKKRPKRKKTLNLVTGKRRHTEKRRSRLLAGLTFWNPKD